MPKKIVNNDAVIGAKNAASKANKKVNKSTARKEILDKAVQDNKGIVHYILMLDDSGSMCGKPW